MGARSSDEYGCAPPVGWVCYYWVVSRHPCCLFYHRLVRLLPKVVFLQEYYIDTSASRLPEEASEAVLGGDAVAVDSSYSNSSCVRGAFHLCVLLVACCGRAFPRVT